MKMTNYSEDYGGMSFLGTIGVIINFVFLPIASLQYLKKIHNAIFSYIEPFIMVGVLFALVRINIPLAYRFQEYFDVHFAILFANILGLLSKRTKQIASSLAISRVYILLIPWLMMNIFLMFRTHKYHPYSSIFDKTVHKDKEKAISREIYYIYPSKDKY